MPTFGQQKYSVDRAATVLAYSQAERGGADTCTCVTCRNFRLARARAFPAKFVALLDRLGIDPAKDAEVYHNARLAPGRHFYAGWYHFVGTLDNGGDFQPAEFGDGFTAYMCNATAPRLTAFEGLRAVQLEFQAENVPWLLAEPEET